MFTNFDLHAGLAVADRRNSGVVLGIPLGVSVGRTVWHAFATKLGVVPADVVTVSALILHVAGIVIGGALLSLVPAGLAIRVRPADALHEPT